MVQKIIEQYTDKELQNIVDHSSSMTQVARKIGYSSYAGPSSRRIKEYMDNHHIDLSGLGQPKEKLFGRLDEKEIFKKDSNVSQHCLGEHYIEGSYSEYRCAICGMPPYWQDKEMNLILDHIDGDHHNDELTNLRWVCPNCNQQLPTTYNRAWRDSKKKKHYYCMDCGKEISVGATRCAKCMGIHNQQQERPDRESLKKMIRESNFTEIGRKYGVRDNTIRKWCKRENLPHRTKDIEAYSDEEWAKI